MNIKRGDNILFHINSHQCKKEMPKSIAELLRAMYIENLNYSFESNPKPNLLNLKDLLTLKQIKA